MYFQYPLESLARRRRREASQLEFARQAKQALADSDELLSRPAAMGLTLYAANEEALEAPTRILRELYGDFVEILPPTVRLIPGEPDQEPVMNVRVVGRLEHASRIESELRRRNADIVEHCVRGRTFIARAEAPLARLLGLRAAIESLSGGEAEPTVRLVRYAPVEGDGLGGAA
jgi:hypothetical protein